MPGRASEPTTTTRSTAREVTTNGFPPSFLKQATAVSWASGPEALFRRTAFAGVSAAEIPRFRGRARDPHRIIDLPEGFTYRVVSWAGDPMDDGLVVPGAPDGMAAFSGPDGLTVLIRNHELSPGSDASGFGRQNERLQKIDASRLFDPGFGASPSAGGTTTLHFDTRAGEVKRQFMSLAGTSRNCAGGPTPWDSWLTCEETVQRAGDICEQDHGWVFEVPASAGGLVEPVALKDMGRFNHEAVAVDPESGCVYLTEDRHDGLFYRFIPNVPGELARGGRLQALVFRDRPGADTRNWDEDVQVKTGERIAVAWMDIEDTFPPRTTCASRALRPSGSVARRACGTATARFISRAPMAAPSRRARSGAYPAASRGRLRKGKPGELELSVESRDAGLIDNADNITVSPWGDLIICEDGSGEQFLVGVTPEGGIYKFGRNATARNSEFAGATFSPDGSTLFVNIQADGITLAITGPWGNRRSA